MKIRCLVFVVLVLSARPVNHRDPRWTTADLFVPEPYASYIAAHAEEIVANGWGIVRPEEFYHGHFLLGAQASELRRFNSLEHALSFTVGALYHTDERVVRWRSEEPRPPRNRVQRSFIGFWGKPVIPAAWMFENPERDAMHYAGFGTIDSRDLMNEHPEQFSMSWRYELRWPDAHCWTVLQFNIQFWEPPEISRVRINDRWHVLTIFCQPMS